MPRETVTASNGALVERLVRLRQAHQVLARELGSTQRRLRQRDREIRELRQALAEHRKRQVPRAA